jgi:hypothetical protein
MSPLFRTDPGLSGNLRSDDDQSGEAMALLDALSSGIAAMVERV